jgi:sec-independent protein translocase protein TatA
MGEFSAWHWMIVLVVVMLLFGSGKVSALMGEFAHGIKAFKKTMGDDNDAPTKGSAGRAEGAQADPAPTLMGNWSDPPTGAEALRIHEPQNG